MRGTVKLLFSYSMDGKRWCLPIEAECEDDARRRLALAAIGTYDGELYATLPGWTLPFGRLVVGVLNWWRLFKAS